jgi:hypothetical protein
LQELSQLGGPDGRIGSPHPRGEQLQEVSETLIVKLRGCLDDLRRGLPIARFQHPRQGVREVVRQITHRPKQ